MNISQEHWHFSAEYQSSHCDRRSTFLLMKHSCQDAGNHSYSEYSEECIPQDLYTTASKNANPTDQG